MSTEAFGLTYQTIRSPECESRTVDFIKAINYTGFGAVTLLLVLADCWTLARVGVGTIFFFFFFLFFFL